MTMMMMSRATPRITPAMMPSRLDDERELDFYKERV
jgi:hypothetical protein